MENVLKWDIFEQAERIVSAEAISSCRRAGDTAEETRHGATRAESCVAFQAQGTNDGEIREGNFARWISRQRHCRLPEASAAVTARLGEVFAEVFEKITRRASGVLGEGKRGGRAGEGLLFVSRKNLVHPL